MKRNIIIAMSIAINICEYTNAQEKMTVEKTNGTKVEFDVTEVSRVYFTQGTPSENPDNEYTHIEAVNLGLPSGIMWASCNIGASKPEEYGEYFA